LGRIFHKPYGYAGDFSVIEAFYNHQVSDDPQLTKWDLYIQDMDAAKAVRNRKTFFKRLIGQHRGDGSTDTRVLNLACGSCRDVYEVLNEYPNARFRFDCVDLDPHAIECASALLGSDNERVNLLRGNVLRFNPGQKKYDLIWSAGLFDYFNDRIFVRLIRRMKKWLEPGGKIVIGNFNEGNPSEHAMAFTEWLLHYRDEDQLRRLAIEAGCVPESISVEQEVTGINLFLTIE
jgi:SAM-dependent methyltransferase